MGGRCVAVLLAATSACADEAAAPPQRHVVEITGFEFAPAEVRVAAGDTIVWVNRDAVPHTATEASGAWDSGRLEESASWTWVAEPGEHAYICALHPAMTGTVVVE